MTQKFEYTGDLADTPLPEALATIHRYRVPGVLEAARGATQKRVYILDGNVIFATSSDLRESLGDMLKASGRLSAEQYDESVRRLKAEKKRQGAVLVEMGVLGARELFDAVREQVQRVVWDLFDWEDGTFTFVVGQFKQDELIKLSVPIRQEILRGLRTVRNAKRLVARVGPSWTVLERTSQSADDIELDEKERRLLELVDGRTGFGDLCARGPFEAPENAKLLYAFVVLHLIEAQKSEPVKVRMRAPRQLS